MMSEDNSKKKVDLNLLFTANQNVLPVTPVTLPHGLSLLAAVLVEFTRDDLEKIFQENFHGKLTDETWGLFSENLIALGSEFLNQQSNTGWMLSESERIQIFRNIKSREEIASVLISVSGRPHRNLLEQMLLAYLDGTAPDPRSQSLAQLSATFTVRRWLQETIFEVPDEKTITARVKQEELLEPFRTLTAEFKGRESQLAQLQDYVDWIPAGNMYSSTVRAAKHLFFSNGENPLLVHGEGGVGKSSLLAKFILDHLGFDRRSFQLPFLYFDFDRPGLSIAEPIRLIADACRQLALQFPDQDQYFIEIGEYIKSEQLRTDIRTRSSDLEYLVARYGENLLSSPAANQPVLLVLDSFEELQYRAQNIEFIEFFNFLTTLKRFIPRLRVVMAGRSNASGEIKVETLPLTDLEHFVAKAYLTTAGVGDAQADYIVSNFGGNPLSLKAAAGVVRNAPADTPMEILFRDISGTLIQQKLISRNLHHLHGDPRLKQLAIPGVVVRRLSPQVIQQVLAEPCGLGVLTISEAELLFRDLVKHVFMIEQRGDIWSFRQDVRESLEPLIKESPEYRIADVHRSAMVYYESAQTPAEHAEYFYHHLKLGGDILSVIHQIDSGIRPYLETSIREFLPDAQVVLAARFGTAVNSGHLAVVSGDAWNYFVLAQERAGLTSRDVNSLEAWSKWFSRRKPGSRDARVQLIECQVNERLGNLDFAERFFPGQLYKLDPQIQMQFVNSLARTYEINRKYQQALDVLRTIHTDRWVGDWTLLLAYILLVKRNCARTNQVYALYDYVNGRLIERCLDNTFTSSHWPFTYRGIAQRYDPENLVDLIKNNEFLGEDRFLERYQIRENEARSFPGLERLVRSRFSQTLKEISSPGSLKAAAHDVSLYAELDDLLRSKILNSASVEEQRSSKRLVICCDGLWYPNSQTRRDILLKTNVERLYNALSEKTPDGQIQLGIYERCVLEKRGFFGEFLRQLSLNDIKESIRNIYHFIVSNYQPGDELYFFGFSKGAYIVRSVVGLIRKCSILKQSSSKNIDAAINLYFNKSLLDQVDGKDATKFRDAYAHPLPVINFLGVWDTIGALGIPFSLLQTVRRRTYQFHDNVLSKIVKHACQALALDERRVSFPPTLWQPSRSKKAVGNKLEQRWFAGTHADIGGGYAERGLSDISLSWMMGKAQEAGLYIDEALLGMTPDPLAEIHRSLTMESFFSTSMRHPDLRDETFQSLDESVLYRIEKMDNYRPGNLVI